MRGNQPSLSSTFLVCVISTFVTMGCGRDATAPLRTGALEIAVATVSTIGEVDTTGYQVSVDNGPWQAVGVPTRLRIDSLARAVHLVMLSGLAANCGVTGDNPLLVDVNPDLGTPLVTFSVSCEPGGPLASVSLCTTGSWTGIQRENQPWQTIPGGGARVSLSLNAGEKIGLAFYPNLGPHHNLEFFFVTAEQAQVAFQCSSSPTKDLQGTVKGPAGTGGWVWMANSSFPLLSGYDFFLQGVPNGPVDLVASGEDPLHKTIIRRSVDYPNGSAIPLLDFGSKEAFALESHTLTVNPTTILFTATNQIVTQRGTNGWLSTGHSTPFSTTGRTTIYSVPETWLTDVELQYLTVVDASDGSREAMVFYRHPSDRTVTLGPYGSTATETRTGTAPNLRLRFDMPSQPEYGEQVTFGLCFVTPGGLSSSGFLATKEYFGGTPATWSVTVPDFVSVEGPSVHSRLCGARVTNIPYLFKPRYARDGDIYMSATAQGVISQ